LLSTMSWRQWSISVLWFAAVLSVVGQDSPVTQCIPSFNWAINSLQQTPCLVASYLRSACGTKIGTPALPVGYVYAPPDATTDPCTCNSVTYSALSACAGCQGRDYVNWTTWTKNCTSPPLTIFPATLPPVVVVVPKWAYLDITQTNNDFNVAAAEKNATETVTSTTSSAASVSVITVTPTATAQTITIISTSLVPTALASPSPTSTDNTPNVGAIAGGVVGGGIGLVFVGLGMLWFYSRRKRNMVQKNVAFDPHAQVSGTGMEFS